MRRSYESWNRYPQVGHQAVIPLCWRSDLPSPGEVDGTVLPFGQGLSYGDTCLNDGGTLLDTSGLSRFIAFDEEAGLCRCEAGVTLGEVLTVAVPRGWFLSVTPGTRHVTVGGAIAHDVHGKNHHLMGTFGCHVPRFELWARDGRILCSPEENRELYRATIGGMGLTGLIVWAELQLQRVRGPYMRTRDEPFGSLDEFWDVAAAADAAWPYTAAWLDGFAPKRRLGRGVLMAGAHADEDHDDRRSGRRTLPALPFDAPRGTLNRLTVGVFNRLYRLLHGRRRTRRVHYQPFCYPLDALPRWNRLYGKRGFFQYQCVVPPDAARNTIREILVRLCDARQQPYLTVLKQFGDRPSPGLMSFPRPGTTLAADLPHRGEGTLRLLDELDRMVLGAGGAVYPAKDARMSREAFRASFPRWEEFAGFVDPRFSSTFWRRVGGTVAD